MPAIDRCADGRRLGLARFPNASAPTRIDLAVAHDDALGRGVAHGLQALVRLPLWAGARAGFFDDGALALRGVELGGPDLGAGRDLTIVSHVQKTLAGACVFVLVVVHVEVEIWVVRLVGAGESGIILLARLCRSIAKHLDIQTANVKLGT